MVQKIGRGGNEGGEGKEEKEEEEEEEKEEDEEEDEEEDKEDEEDEQDEAKRREEGRGEGGGSLSKISSEETLSKLRLKLNQNKAKSTKHAGRPAEFNWEKWTLTPLQPRVQHGTTPSGFLFIFLQDSVRASLSTSSTNWRHCHTHRDVLWLNLFVLIELPSYPILLHVTSLNWHCG